MSDETKWTRPPYKLAVTPAGKPKIVYGAGDWSIATGADALPETVAAMQLFRAAPALYEALAYARRWLNAEDHDTAFVDAALALARGEGSEG